MLSAGVIDSALGKATVKAIAQIVESVKAIQLAPGGHTTSAANEQQKAQSSLRKIRGTMELVDGKDIWVSLSSKTGFAKGDKSKLYQPIEKKNQQGNVVLTTYKEVAEIELVKVQKDKSSEGWAAVDAAIDIDTIE